MNKHQWECNAQSNLPFLMDAVRHWKECGTYFLKAVQCTTVSHLRQLFCSLCVLLLTAAWTTHSPQPHHHSTRLQNPLSFANLNDTAAIHKTSMPNLVSPLTASTNTTVRTTVIWASRRDPIEASYKTQWPWYQGIAERIEKENWAEQNCTNCLDYIPKAMSVTCWNLKGWPGRERHCPQPPTATMILGSTSLHRYHSLCVRKKAPFSLMIFLVIIWHRNNFFDVDNLLPFGFALANIMESFYGILKQCRMTWHFLNTFSVTS